MGKPKQQRKSNTSSANKKKNVVADDNVIIGGEDRLSNLPECILTDILSRLSTRDAIQTSVLSKKWEFRWTSIYNLEFNDIHFGGRGRNRKERFSSFVDRVLMECRSTSLRKFYLSCSSSSTINYDSNRINTWITAAVLRDVQILLIDLDRKSILLPRFTIYNIRNGLKELIVLSTLTIRVPDDVLFTTLTKIELNQVVLLGSSNNNNNGGGATAEDGERQPVVLKLPFLEYLNMFCCKWKNVNAVKFEVPMLSSFNMTMMTLSNRIKELLEGFVFTVCAGSKLMEINLSGNLLESYGFLMSSQVQNASIKLMFFPQNWIVTGIRIVTTLNQMSSTLKFLELSGESLNAMDHAAKFGRCLPFFGSLIYLKLHTTNYWCTDGAAVINIIKQAPVLQTLIVETVAEVGNNLRFYEITNTEEDGIIPTCFHSHLKTVKFISTYNCLTKENDTNLIKFILENASVLEELHFINSPQRRSVPSSKIQKLVLSFPRASSVAQIQFM